MTSLAYPVSTTRESGPDSDLPVRPVVLPDVQLRVPARLITDRLESRSGVTERLRTRRLVIRPLCDLDRDEFCRVLELSRSHLAACMPLQAEGQATLAAFEHALKLGERGDATRSGWRRIGVDHTGRIVGGCAIHTIVRGLSAEASMNWWVSADAIGRGLGTEMVCAALRHAIENFPDGLGLDLINASIHPCNAASIALAQRLGFVRRGRARQPMLVGDRWERLDEYEYHAPIGDQFAGGEEPVLVAVPGASGTSDMPGSGWSVPSRAIRS